MHTTSGSDRRRKTDRRENRTERAGKRRRTENADPLAGDTSVKQNRQCPQYSLSATIFDFPRKRLCADVLYIYIYISVGMLARGTLNSCFQASTLLQTCLHPLYRVRIVQRVSLLIRSLLLPELRSAPRDVGFRLASASRARSLECVRRVFPQTRAQLGPRLECPRPLKRMPSLNTAPGTVCTRSQLDATT